MTQASQGNRRGSVFAVRVTDEEREALRERKALLGGPRALGPWLVWRALAGESPSSSAAEVVPELFREEVVPVQERVVLDLCSGSGSWSAPYVAAGYPVRRVTLPDDDVRTFVVPRDRVVWGVLAAPPCDQFSLVRNGHDTPRDFVRGLECVNACLRIVLQARPRWWALENPVGLLGNWLGTPRDVFQPHEFGDPWTKRTALWGEFALPKRGPFVAPKGGGPLCEECGTDDRWCNDSGHRARTPGGFARAFFEANP